MKSAGNLLPTIMALCCLSLWIAGTAQSGTVTPTPSDAARQISQKSSPAVIAVRIVAKMRMVVEGKQMDESERVDQIRATVIHPSGLAVCSLSEVDPSRSSGLGGNDPSGYKLEAEVTDVKILHPDGKETPAKVVLRDEDLDLAFIRPTEAPPEPMISINLHENAELKVLDEVVVLGRLGEVGNRSPSVTLDRVQAVVTKPRTFYITGIYSWMAGLGCPVFALDGQAVGVLVVHSIPAVSAGGAGYGDSMPVVLPAADILQAAKQVPPQ